jgi:hypothetical protein
MQRCSSSLLASLSAFASACAVLSAFNRQSSKFHFPSRCPDGSDELAPKVMSVIIVKHISPMIRFSSSPLLHLIWRSFLLRYSARHTLRSRFVPTGEAPIVIITVSECRWRPRTVLIIMLIYVTGGKGCLRNRSHLACIPISPLNISSWHPLLFPGMQC